MVQFESYIWDAADPDSCSSSEAKVNLPLDRNFGFDLITIKIHLLISNKGSNTFCTHEETTEERSSN